MRTKTNQNKLAEELFYTVYSWGVNGVVVDEKNLVYRSMLGRLLGNKSNGFHRGTNLECFIENCKFKHLPF